MYAASSGAVASRRRPARSGFPPAVYQRIRRKPQIYLQAKWGIEYRTGVKRGDAAACRMEKAPPHRGGALLHGRCCGGRGECRTSPINMYAAYVGAAVQRRRPPRSGRRPDSPMMMRRGIRIFPRTSGRACKGDRHPVRRRGRPAGQAPTLRGGSLLGGSCCRGAANAIHAQRYVFYPNLLYTTYPTLS